MKVELFVLCDAATDYQGKLNILGTFDSIWSRQVPAVHPLCAVALRLRFEKKEEGEHKVRISIVDQDGVEVVKPVDATVNVRFRDVPLQSLATNIILNLQVLTFPRYGAYSINLVVDGREGGSLPLVINQIPPQANN